MARVRRKITNDKAVAIQVAGRWIQPGNSEVFDLEQLPAEWRSAGVEVPDTTVKKVPAMITEGRQALEYETTSDGGIRSEFPIPISILTIGVPFVIPPGDGGTNGLAFTGGGGGAFTLSAGLLAGAGALLSNCYVWLPANAGGSGCAAGWYYCRFTSDSAGTIYGDSYSAGIPAIPQAPTAFPGSPSGRITTTTAEVVGPSVGTVLGRSMGKSGTLRWFASLLGDAAAVKQFRLKLAGSTAMVMQTGSTPLADLEQQMQNQGVANRQRVTRNASAIGGQVASILGNSLSLDTDQDLPVSISLQMSTTAGCAILLGVDLTVKYGA